jgi:hypothetical protein
MMIPWMQEAELRQVLVSVDPSHVACIHVRATGKRESNDDEWESDLLWTISRASVRIYEL